MSSLIGHSFCPRSCRCIDSWVGDNCAEAPANVPLNGPNLCAANNGGCDALTSCSLAFGGRQCGECPYPMYRTTFGADGASVCVDVDECDTKPCWQVWSLVQTTFDQLHA